MIEGNLPALQVIIPMLSAPICAMMPTRRLAWFLTCVAAGGAFVVALALAAQVLSGSVVYYPMGNWNAPFGIEYRIDALNSFVLLLVSGIGFVTACYCGHAIDDDVEDAKQPLFYAMFLLCLTGLLGIVITNDIFNVYVFLEISSLASYAMVAMGRGRRALVAAFEYLVLGTIGATFILLGIGLLYMVTGTLNISDLALRVPAVAHSMPVKAALAFFTVGLALKIAMFPLHLGMVNAYTHAPSAVSAFLSGTATKVGIYVFIRVIFTIFGAHFALQEMQLAKVLMGVSFIAIFVGSLVAMFQHNIKRMLAYSSVAQIGYILLGISLVSQAGLASALVTLLQHAMIKSTLFMAVGCILLRAGGVQFRDFSGLGRTMPVTMAAFLIAGLGLVGVPLTGGFVSKWYLLMALVDQGLWPVLAVIIVSSLLTLIYVWRIVEVAYFGEPAVREHPVREAPISMLLPMWTMAAMTLVFGVYSGPVVNFALQVAKNMVGI